MVFWIHESFLSSCDSGETVEWYDYAAVRGFTFVLDVVTVQHSSFDVLVYSIVHTINPSPNKTIQNRILIAMFTFCLTFSALFWRRNPFLLS